MGARASLDEALAVCAEVLGLDAVAPEDHFIDIGGDSLISIVLAARLEAVLGCEVPIDGLFLADSLGALLEPLVAGVVVSDG